MGKPITIDGVKYIPESEIKSLSPAPSVKGKKFCIVRTYSAGVFAGYLGKMEGKQVDLLDARRLWYWAGAASLSQLAVDGTSKPNDCKFPVAVPQVTLTEVIEVIPCSAKAKASIDAVPVWKQ